ncbi:glycine--tRNA ligase [Candidatus Woesearchaeota archaeon]|nr:glycine--tRNA ligase [Candidatus Woesearchaeota archaeon]
MDRENQIEEVARRRGFFFQASEMYGGLSGFYDYAHLGTMMKRKWENLWRKFFLGLDDNFFEIEPADIMPEQVFVASGHLKSFVDPVVKCKHCGNMERADHLVEKELKENFEGMPSAELEKLVKKHNIKCPKCGGEFKEVGVLNMMFPVTIGGDVTAYLRPETAQGAYVNFKREFESLRKKLPLGLAIIGKAYRNEISPRNMLMRMREFTQAELQVFFDPDTIKEHKDFAETSRYELRIFAAEDRESNKITDVTCEQLAKRLPKFYVYHMAKMQQFYTDVLKIPRHLIRFRELSGEEKAFYNKYHWDIEICMEGGFREIGGCHYRTDHDLAGHSNLSKKDLSVFVEGKKVIPHVVELSFGVDRNILSLLEIFYGEEKERTLFRFPRRVAPYDCAVFPLVSKDGLPEKAAEIRRMLKGLNVFYDKSGSIGRRYRRMDEIGVPACVTIDHQTLEDNTVTLRDRDSMKQVRVKIGNLEGKISEFLDGKDIEEL